MMQPTFVAGTIILYTMYPGQPGHLGCSGWPAGDSVGVSGDVTSSGSVSGAVVVTVGWEEATDWERLRKVVGW